jgi:hypothetical protein
MPTVMGRLAPRGLAAPASPVRRALGAGQDAGQDAAFGAGAGALATAAMSALMLAAQRAGLMGKQPPEAITETILDGAGVETPSEQIENAISTVLHLAFGAAAGGLFEVGRRRLFPSSGLAVPAGAAWGLAVWAVSYAGWIPWLRILPPPDEDRTDRQVVMVAAHVVYGATLGALAGRRPARRTRGG